MLMTERFVKYPYHLRYVHPSATEHDVVLGMTTRQGGLSAYPEHAFNMARYIDDRQEHVTYHQEQLAEVLGIPREHWVFPIQTHENRIAHVTQADRMTNMDTLTSDLHGIDGLYTYDQDVMLTMCYADCVPIYFYSTKHHYIGLAHAGWRGTVSQIVTRMLEAIPFDLRDVHVVIGPSTSDTYEINDDIKRQFEALPINTADYIEKRAENRYGIDLKKANARLCEVLGVPAENIYTTTYATSEDTSLFFSYRIEQGQTGRMLAFISQ